MPSARQWIGAVQRLSSVCCNDSRPVAVYPVMKLSDPVGPRTRATMRTRLVPNSRLVLGILLTCLLAGCADIAGSANVAGNASADPSVTGTTATTPATSIIEPSDPPMTSSGRSTRAPDAPGCTGKGTPPPNRPNPPPLGDPIITVTHGANHWIGNRTVEPLALSIYPGGLAIVSRGTGERDQPLPVLASGWLSNCLIDWAQQEIMSMSILDMGEPTITDQGTTTLRYTPTAGDPVTISVYALGVGDHHVSVGKANRARFSAMLTALRHPLDDAPQWSPTRLLVVQTPLATGSADTLTWPGPLPLEKVLVGKRGTSRCGFIYGATLRAVMNTLGKRPIHSKWADDGKIIGLQVGPLVPGQKACD